MQLTDRDRAFLDGEGSAAEELAMRLVVGVAEAMEAETLLDVTSAHVDSCLYLGQAGLDFAELLVSGGARVSVPTTLNVASLDLLHPEAYKGDQVTASAAKRLMSCYEAMGCAPTWTCAPYQLEPRPAFGQHVAWAESSAIVFVNSVLGARSHRYGDFIDICVAITGRAPAAGLHLDEGRRGEVVYQLRGFGQSLLQSDVLYPLLGHVIGSDAGGAVPVIEGLDVGATEDQLKALGAAAASSGAVGMFHAVGVTPEAQSLAEALGGQQPRRIVEIRPRRLAEARDELSTAVREPRCVCLGTPHASPVELERLVALLAGRRPSLPIYVNTSRGVANEVAETVSALESAGVRVVFDTCTYITPILADEVGTVMTDSAKWAYYAPANIGAEVLFGSTLECVESAVAGELRRSEELWDEI